MNPADDPIWDALGVPDLPDDVRDEAERRAARYREAVQRHPSHDGRPRPRHWDPEQLAYWLANLHPPSDDPVCRCGVPWCEYRQHVTYVNWPA